MPQLADEYGDYPDMFAGLLGRTDTEFRTWHAQRGEFPQHASDADAFVITGSRCSVYDDELWIKQLAQCVNRLIDTGACVVGVCFGHQLIAHFRGGETASADAGWGVGVRSAEVIENTAQWRPANAANAYSLVASHKDQVRTMPEGATRWAMSEFCPISGYTIDSSVLTIQQHPEYSRKFARAFMTLRAPILGPEVLAAGLASLDRATDSPVVAGWIHSFIDGAS